MLIRKYMSFSSQPLPVKTAIVIGLLTAIGGGLLSGNLLVFLTLALVYIIVVYNTHCLISGSCVVWSWVQLVYPALFGATLLYAGYTLGGQDIKTLLASQA
jgi:uncharacterized membrane protein YeiH